MRRDEDAVIRATQDWWDEPEQAMALLNDFLLTNPESIRARLRLASIFDLHHEDLARAEELYRSVLAEDPDNVTALSRLGLLHAHPGSTVEAEESLALLQRAAELSGEAWAWENLANKAWDTCHLDSALSAYVKLLSIAREQGLGHLVKTAEKAIKAIRRGELKSKVGGYSAPEI